MTVLLDPQEIETAALLAYTGDLDNLRIIEIGCGDGRLTRRYASRPAHVTAIDPSLDKIARAQENLPFDLRGRVEYIAADLEQFVSWNGGQERFNLAILAWSL
jgi:2-polyprenyl-3-methyl-5-hydroxy-6-metoxy-1,4-benzoquinol methylase